MMCKRARRGALWRARRCSGLQFGIVGDWRMMADSHGARTRIQDDSVEAEER